MIGGWEEPGKGAKNLRSALAFFPYSSLFSHSTVMAGSADDSATSPAGSAPAREESAGFMKLAMRNMVRKGRQSLLHFGLTALGLSAFLLLLAWLGRPRLPL